MDYEKLSSQVIAIAKDVAVFIGTEKEKINPNLVEKKGLHDFVTYVDKMAEQKIIAKLRKLLPESGFLAEEQTTTQKGEVFNWIIDPLDGTTNFIHGLAPHAISIALEKQGEIVLGVIYEMALQECFYAWKNGGAFLNGRPISVTNTILVDESLIATGFPYYDYSKMKGFLETLEYFMQHSHGIRRLGSAATDLAYVACGRFEAFYEYSLKPWDVAAGALIVHEAGGRVSDFSGGDDYLHGGEIIATNRNVFREFLEIVNTRMKKYTD